MPKRKAVPDPRYAQQPAVAAILKMLDRPRGTTIAEIAKARGLEPHTVRAIISRIGSQARVEVSRTKIESRGGLVYRVAKKMAGGDR
jgi:DNA-binding MarR family transcriptional regulator